MADNTAFSAGPSGASAKGAFLGTTTSSPIRQTPHEERCQGKFFAFDRATGEIVHLPCKSSDCEICSRQTANRARRKITQTLVGALEMGLAVHRLVLTTPDRAHLAEFQRRRGRVLEDAKRKGLIEGYLTVIHSHRSGVAHAHVFTIGRRKVRRSDWISLLRRHGLGIRKGFYLAPISGVKQAHGQARYVTDQLVGLKARLERANGPIKRLRAVIITPTVRCLAGVVRRRRPPEPGRWMVFRAPLAFGGSSMIAGEPVAELRRLVTRT
jgi:hypothetical protein